MTSSPTTPGDGDLDRIGDWSVEKLNILSAYSEQYAAILQNQVTASGKRKLHFGYIDGFAGAGEHVHKNSGKVISGSPQIALKLPFDEFHFVDLDPARIERLKKMCVGTPSAHVHQGDCNTILTHAVFPLFKWDDYRRALCFLDPYGMDIHWKVIAQAGKMRSIEIFLNFPVMDINRNAKRSTLEGIDPLHRQRMTALWGDESWHAAMYAPSDQSNFLGQLLGGEENSPEIVKKDNDTLAQAFRKRLQEVGGFEFVPAPVPMRNSTNAVVYYLFFASNNTVGNRIASHILKNYRS
jgi:three-Cys-motif partner protein